MMLLTSRALPRYSFRAYSHLIPSQVGEIMLGICPVFDRVRRAASPAGVPL
jgi:hypothetical protein